MTMLSGRVVLVTGGGGGLGREQALLFAREGARVVVNDLGCARDGTGSSREAADEVVAAIRQDGGEAVATYDSVARTDGADAVVRRAIETFGRLDVVVHNAGIVSERTLLKMDDRTFDEVIETNLRGTFAVTRAAARAMLDGGAGGSIVCTSAAAGIYGHLAQSHYAAANAGVWAFARSAAIELKKHGIRVNVIVPLAKTRMTEDLPMFKTVSRETMGPAHVAPLALFLASDLGADVTGEILGVAGGRLYAFKVRESNGAFLERPFSPEEIRAAWPTLTKL